MADSLRLDVSLLVALILQALFYGIHLVLFGTCCYVLFYRKKTARTNYMFFSVSVAIFVVTTLNFAVSWSRIMDAFIMYQGTTMTPTLYFSNLANWKEVARTGFYCLLCLIADSFLIYRVYMVWERNVYVIILPTFIMLASISCGFTIVGELTAAADGVFSTILVPFITAYFSLGLAQNLISTTLIVFRIWKINIASGHAGSSNLWPVIIVVVESGAIYSSAVFVQLMAYVSGSNAQYIMVDILAPLVGITFYMIIVRIGLGVVRGRSALHSEPMDTNAYGRGVRSNNVQYPMGKIAVTVARNVAVDEDDDSPYRTDREDSIQDKGDTLA